MTSKPNPDSLQDDAIENFRKRLAAVRRKVFGRPFPPHPWLEIGETIYANGADLARHYLSKARKDREP